MYYEFAHGAHRGELRYLVDSRRRVGALLTPQVGYAWILLLIYPLGTPLLYIWLYWINRKKMRPLIDSEAQISAASVLLKASKGRNFNTELFSRSSASADFQQVPSSPPPSPPAADEEQQSKSRVSRFTFFGRQGSFEESVRRPRVSKLQDVLKDIATTSSEVTGVTVELPKYMLTLVGPYDYKCYWYETVECARKVRALFAWLAPHCDAHIHWAHTVLSLLEVACAPRVYHRCFSQALLSSSRVAQSASSWSVSCYLLSSPGLSTTSNHIGASLTTYSHRSHRESSSSSSSRRSCSRTWHGTARHPLGFHWLRPCLSLCVRACLLRANDQTPCCFCRFRSFQTYRSRLTVRCPPTPLCRRAVAVCPGPLLSRAREFHGGERLCPV